MDKETRVILDAIEKANIFNNNHIIIKINEDQETFRKDYEFQVIFGEIHDNDFEVETVESTGRINILNNVMRHLLNNDFAISFDFEQY